MDYSSITPRSLHPLHPVVTAFLSSSSFGSPLFAGNKSCYFMFYGLPASCYAKLTTNQFALGIKEKGNRDCAQIVLFIKLCK